MCIRDRPNTDSVMSNCFVVLGVFASWREMVLAGMMPSEHQLADDFEFLGAKNCVVLLPTANYYRALYLPGFIIRRLSTSCTPDTAPASALALSLFCCVS